MIAARESLAGVPAYQLPVASRKDKIRLDFNENIRGCSPKVLEAIRNIGADDIAVYPEYLSLVKKIANYHNVDPENVLLTNGADDAIRCVMDAYVEEGDEVIIPVPTFSMFGILARLRGARIVEILYNEDFSFPLERLLNAITERTRMVVVVNPNSPTGTSIGREDLVQILIKAGESVVLLDETYHHFARRSYVELIKDFPNLIVMQTFSKAWGLAGLRLGFIVSHRGNIEHLGKVSLPFPVNSLAIVAGNAALEDRRYVEEVVREVEIEKEFLCEGLRGLGLSVNMTDTNFLLVDLGIWGDKVHERLMDRGILVKNLSDLPLLKGFLRITVGTRKENLLLLEALRETIPLEALLFDMDGVLVDVSASYRLAIKKTVERFLGKDISLEEIQEYKARGGYNNDWDLTEAIMLSHGLRVPKEEIIDVFQHFYLGSDFNGFVSNERWLLNREVLEELSMTYKLGIVTGRPRVEAEHALSKFGVERYFDVVIAMEDVPPDRAKPDPYGIELALRKLGVKRALYAGDNIDDIKSAVSAGVVPVGIISPLSDEDKMARIFEKAGAKQVLRSVNHILEVLP